MTKAAKSKWHPKMLKKTFIDIPFYIITHPFKGFDEMKSQGLGEIRYAVVFLLLYGMVRAWQIMSTGFVVTGFWWDQPSINVPEILLYTFSPIALICIANWSITSITNGSGRLKEIFMVYCYALYPSLFLRIIGTVLSNNVTVGEAAFATFFFSFGNVLLYFFLFIGLLVIHEYTFFRGVLMVILTALAAMVIVFVLALFFSLLGEVINFIFTIVQELDAHVL